jgi:hypothetical protein
MPDNIVPKSKLRRVSRACDYCHHRSVKCQPSGDDGTHCQNCLEFHQPCTFERQMKRRGGPHRSRFQRASELHHVSMEGEAARPSSRLPYRSSNDIQEKRSPNHDSSSRHPQNCNYPRQATPPTVASGANSNGIAKKWQAPYIASQATMMDLVELYFEIVYPIFPFYHQPTFIRSISRGEYTTKRTLFAATMAVCALVSARARDGAISNPRWNIESLQATESEVLTII